MMKASVELLQLWYRAGEMLREAAARGDEDRGEVTGQTALIVLLVTAAIAAGVAITAVMASNTDNIPSP